MPPAETGTQAPVRILFVFAWLVVGDRCHQRCGGTLLSQLFEKFLAPLVARLLRFVQAPLDTGSLFVDDLVEPVRDVLVDTAEVVAVADVLRQRQRDAHRRLDPAQLRQNVAAWTAMLAVLAGPVEPVGSAPRAWERGRMASTWG